MKRSPIEVFNEWATLDKDFGMEQNHKRSVENMLTFALKHNNSFSFIDAGCGNGWVVKKVGENQLCNYAVGVDGSDKMIEKARTLDPSGSYVCADLMSWYPEKPVDIVHSMEVFYYLKNPKNMIQKIFDSWLKKNGSLIIGIDFYFENKVSHNWSDSCGISNMKLYSEESWINFFKISGFNSVKSWRFGAKKDWAGTLIVRGVK